MGFFTILRSFLSDRKNIVRLLAGTPHGLNARLSGTILINHDKVIV